MRDPAHGQDQPLEARAADQLLQDTLPLARVEVHIEQEDLRPSVHNLDRTIELIRVQPPQREHPPLTIAVIASAIGFDVL
jgi:hypothetical protein